MLVPSIDAEKLKSVCESASPAEGLAGLKAAINSLGKELSFESAMTRGHWHRLGGVVDSEHRRINDNIARWAEEESQGDVEQLLAMYGESGYLATKLAGKTHYFTMCTGDQPEDFLQVEVEELQEVLDRPLIESDWFPEDLEEFLDPLDYPRLAPETVGEPYYVFRRLTSIAELLAKAPIDKRTTKDLKRFFHDWQISSAGEGMTLCQHWVMALREYLDSGGEVQHLAKPVSVYPGRLPELPEGESLSGSALANAIHGYDRILGYPFAWYFIMVTQNKDNVALADAVLRDQMGAYDYLPSQDLKVLRAWEESPYAL
ncbi:MAG: hypothetical protein AB2814_00010 [Candidatus Sedimenticola endophacoides]